MAKKKKKPKKKLKLSLEVCTNEMSSEDIGCMLNNALWDLTDDERDTFVVKVFKEVYATNYNVVLSALAKNVRGRYLSAEDLKDVIVKAKSK